MRVYRVPFSGSFTAQIDLVELVGASGGLEWLTEIRIGQTTELGDAQEEQLSISLVTGHTTSGSGGNTSVVPSDSSKRAKVGLPDASAELSWVMALAVATPEDIEPNAVAVSRSSASSVLPERAVSAFVGRVP